MIILRKYHQLAIWDKRTANIDCVHYQIMVRAYYLAPINYMYKADDTCLKSSTSISTLSPLISRCSSGPEKQDVQSSGIILVTGSLSKKPSVDLSIEYTS